MNGIPIEQYIIGLLPLQAVTEEHEICKNVMKLLKLNEVRRLVSDKKKSELNSFVIFWDSCHPTPSLRIKNAWNIKRNLIPFQGNNKQWYSFLFFRQHNLITKIGGGHWNEVKWWPLIYRRHRAHCGTRKSVLSISHSLFFYQLVIPYQ